MKPLPFRPSAQEERRCTDLVQHQDLALLILVRLLLVHAKYAIDDSVKVLKLPKRNFRFGRCVPNEVSLAESVIAFAILLPARPASTRSATRRFFIRLWVGIEGCVDVKSCYLCGCLAHKDTSGKHWPLATPTEEYLCISSGR